jgi:integrase
MARGRTDTEKREKRGFGNIRKLPSGRYQVRYTGPDGSYVTAPKTFATRMDAEAHLTDRRREIDADLWNAAAARRPEKVTFGAYASGWLESRQVAGRPIKARTREHYQAILDDHLLDVFGQRHLSAITPKDVRDWHASALADRPTMRSHAYSLLRTIMNSAVNDELIESNPCRIVGASRAKRVHKIRPATLDEIAALAWEMPRPYRAMVLLAAWCALRFGELTELRRRDVLLTIPPAGSDDEPEGVVRVERAVVRVDGGFQVTTPKSDAGARDVAVPPHLVPYLQRHMDEFAPKPDDLLFPAAHGGHLAPATLYRRFYTARERVGREDLRWHDLRHSGAVLAAATGASLAELMARLGHSTPAAAMRYQHAAHGRDRQIAALLSKLAQNGGA